MTTSEREALARRWHALSDHAAGGTPFGGPLCNCTNLAPRLAAIAAHAWARGHHTERRLGPDDCECGAWNDSECGCGEYGSNIVTPNPYAVRDDDQ